MRLVKVTLVCDDLRKIQAQVYLWPCKNVENYSCVVFSGHSHTLKPNNRIKSKEHKSSTLRPELIYFPNHRPPRAHWILFVASNVLFRNTLILSSPHYWQGRTILLRTIKHLPWVNSERTTRSKLWTKLSLLHKNSFTPCHSCKTNFIEFSILNISDLIFFYLWAAISDSKIVTLCQLLGENKTNLHPVPQAESL